MDPTPCTLESLQGLWMESNFVALSDLTIELRIHEIDESDAWRISDWVAGAAGGVLGAGLGTLWVPVQGTLLGASVGASLGVAASVLLDEWLGKEGDTVGSAQLAVERDKLEELCEQRHELARRIYGYDPEGGEAFALDIVVRGETLRYGDNPVR